MVPEEESISDAELLALSERLRNAERRAAVFRVASALGHLIGTPLNVIAGRAALIRAIPAEGNPAEHAKKIEEQVERLAVEVRRLIDYLTPPDSTSEAASVTNVVGDAVSLCRPFAPENGASIVVESEDGATSALVDRTSTLLVLTTLLSLAVRTRAHGAKLELRAKTDVSRNIVSFDLSAPGMPHPTIRIDRLEAPQEPSALDMDALQALSICSSVAQRRGGSVKFGEDAEHRTVVSFACPRID